MNRRQFLKTAGLAVGTSAALVAVPKTFLAAQIMKPKPQHLPLAAAGDVITAESWNAIIERINELSQETRS